MGSKSWSTTSYQSTPVSNQDSDNALTLAGTRNQTGQYVAQGSLSNIGDKLIQGNVGANSSVSVLDGGAISNAFDFAAKVADLVSKANVDALGFAERAGQSAMAYVDDSTNADSKAEKQTNYTLWVLAGLGLAFMYFKYGRGGR